MCGSLAESMDWLRCQPSSVVAARSSVAVGCTHLFVGQGGAASPSPPALNAAADSQATDFHTGDAHSFRIPTKAAAAARNYRDQSPKNAADCAGRCRHGHHSRAGSPYLFAAMRACRCCAALRGTESARCHSVRLEVSDSCFYRAALQGEREKHNRFAFGCTTATLPIRSRGARRPPARNLAAPAGPRTRA